LYESSIAINNNNKNACHENGHLFISARSLKKFDQVGKEGFEPSRLSARDPKSRLSANSSTSPKIFIQPWIVIIRQSSLNVNKSGKIIDMNEI
jgi:hypothetical protein